MNEEPRERKYSDPTPQIISPEQMPASIGAIEVICNKLHLILEASGPDGGSEHRSIELDKSNEDIQDLFPGIYRIAVVTEHQKTRGRQTTDLFMYFDDHVVGYHIDLTYKDGLMEITKVIDFTDDTSNGGIKSYEDREKVILDLLSADKLEKEMGIRQVSLTEARDISKLLDFIVA